MNVTIPNGYTVSVIDDGYGSHKGLLEIACWETESGNWCEREPFNGDVIGWRTWEEISSLIDLVKSWTPIGQI